MNEVLNGATITKSLCGTSQQELLSVHVPISMVTSNNHIDSTVVSGGTIHWQLHTGLHYNTVIHRDVFEIERLKEWDYTITNICAYSHPLLAMSRRTKGATGADSMGNLAPSGCYACVIVYH